MNNVSVTLEDDARWTVTGHSIITRLAVGGNAAVAAPEGKSLSVTVDGEAVQLESGREYAGVIEIKAE